MIVVRFLPPEVFLLALILIGFALILGIIKRERAFALVGLVCLVAILQPFIPALVAQIPWWVYLIVFPVVVLLTARAAVSMVLGKAAASHMLGTLAADAVRFALARLFRKATRPGDGRDIAP